MLSLQAYKFCLTFFILVSPRVNKVNWTFTFLRPVGARPAVCVNAQETMGKESTLRWDAHCLNRVQ